MNSNQQIELKDLSTLELKGLAYDFSVQQSQTAANLQLINQEIAARQSQVAELQKAEQAAALPLSSYTPA